MDLNRNLIKFLESFYRAGFNFIINLLPDDGISNLYLRPAVFRMLGVRCGKDCQIRKHIYIEHHKNVVIGTNVNLFGQSYIDALGGVTIGNNVRIGPKVVMVTGKHETGRQDQRGGKTYGEPIIIGDGCWIGVRVTITSGVAIGEGCIVSAGAVVQRSMPPNYLIAGNPARPISQLSYQND